MRLSPVTKLAALGGVAVGTLATALVFANSGGGHAPQQSTYQIRQDAQTGAAVVTSAAPKTSSAAPVAPKPAAASSTVVVRHSAAVQQQEAPVVTDPTSDPAPVDTAQPAASSYPPPRGNPVGTVFNNPYPSATLHTDAPDPAPSSPQPH